MRDIGKNIRLLRSKQNITQDELAEKLFVSRQTISNYETGRSRPDIDTLMRISEILDVEAQDLLYGPPISQARTNAKHRLVVACCALIVIAILCQVADGFCYSSTPTHFRSSAAYSLWLLLRPCLFLMIGWTVMQGLSLLPKSKILPFDTRYAHRIITAIIFVYFLIVTIFCVGILRIDWLSYQYSLSDSVEAFHESFSMPVVLPLARFFSNHRNNLWIVFVPLGVFLWLFDRPRQSDEL